MGERAIAEIIGWVRCGRCKKHWNLGDEWGSERPINESPTVDDLLAWLRTQHRTLFNAEFEGVEEDGTDAPIYAVQFDEYTPDGSSWLRLNKRFEAPTLLAALEAAVRAVDQSSLAAAGKPAGEAPTLAPPTPATTQTQDLPK